MGEAISPLAFIDEDVRELRVSFSIMGFTNYYCRYMTTDSSLLEWFRLVFGNSD